MKVLLFTSKEEDYLQDSIIHGFKQLIGKSAIDYPAKEMLYDDYDNLKNIRGRGFTLYGLLSSDLKPQEDLDVSKEIIANRFDLIIFSSIHRQYKLFYEYFSLLKKSRAVVWIMDGEDSPVVFPYLGKDLKRFLFSPRPHRHFIYFKRELSPQTVQSIYYRFPVNGVNKFLMPYNIKPISFSIPSEKIIESTTEKTKLFAQHIVDKEVAMELHGSENTTLFECEKDYYADIQKSKFGITTKRAGWDCLRHYEIAGNGAVICFKDLMTKPELCAPHGLVSGVNCISYSNYSGLQNQIESLSDFAYQNLQKEGLKWVKNNTTIECVKKLIDNYYRKND